jgi:hypothetical protein
MSLNLPQSGRVVVIDDHPEEVLPLMKVLSKGRISVNYFTGKKEELPEVPFLDVRLVFLDIVLEGAEGTDDKTKLSMAIGVIKRIIHRNNGPFILAVWTKHKELIKGIEGRLKGENYQPIVTDLQKYEFKDSKGDNKYDFLQIEKKLKEKLKNLGIFEIFILWENMVYNSSSSVVNEFSRFVEFNDSWNDKLKQIFYKLAEAWASKRLNNNSSQDIIRNAFFTFGGIFADTFEKNIHQEPEESYNQMDFSSLKSEVEKEVKGKINSRLLVDRSQLDGLYPGNVYENNRETHIKESLSTGGNAMKIEEIKNKSIPVIIEVSPLCDFVQDKMKLSRIVEGFLCPVEVQINGTTIQTYKELKSSTHFLYISPVIEHEEKLYRLVIDFRYFSANSIDEINENTPIFRLRKDILIDIQTKLSSHINRPGVLFIE